MITADTKVNTSVAQKALIGTTVAVLLAIPYLLYANKEVVYIIGLVAGTIVAAVPILRAIRKTPPQTMADVSNLSRTSTKSFVMWLIMMGIYLVMLMPMGPEIFKLGVSTCVVGLLTSRLGFPAYTAFLVAFGQPSSSHEP